MQKARRASLIEAAQRWERVLDGASPAGSASFASWIRQSPHHLAAYLHHLAIHTELQRMDSSGEFDVAALLAKAATNVIELPAKTPRTVERSHPGDDPGHRLIFGLAVTTIASVLGLAIAGSSSRPPSLDHRIEPEVRQGSAAPNGAVMDPQPLAPGTGRWPLQQATP
jgi:ferric-dicitrate binding protein FerR (iron transport regulator)